MLNNHRLAFIFIGILLFSLHTFGQNKFEGYNLFLDVPETHTVATCTLRYVAPETEITITDLDRKTPLKVSNCGDTTAKVAQRRQQRDGDDARQFRQLQVVFHGRRQKLSDKF